MLEGRDEYHWDSDYGVYINGYGDKTTNPFCNHPNGEMPRQEEGVNYWGNIDRYWDYDD